MIDAVGYGRAVSFGRDSMSWAAIPAGAAGTFERKIAEVPGGMMMISTIGRGWTMPGIKPVGLFGLLAGALIGSAATGTASELYVTGIELVSTNSVGQQGNLGSTDADLSPDGNKVVFSSEASNLVPNDTNEKRDIFLKDLQTGSVRRLSVDANGVQANQASENPRFSPDGGSVVFSSRATNLVPRDWNRVSDIFRFSLTTGAITRLSVYGDGSQHRSHSSEPVFSASGHYVFFRGRGVLRKNLSTGGLTMMAIPPRSNRYPPGPLMVSPNPERVSFIDEGGIGGTSSSKQYLYTKNLKTGRLSAVAIGPAYRDPVYARYFWPTMSPNGRYFAYNQDCHGSNECLGNGASGLALRRIDGSLVAWFDSGRTVPGFTPDSRWLVTTGPFGELRARSIATGLENVLISGTGTSMLPRFSADGRKMVFRSGASDLVPGDTNSEMDVFVATIEER